MGRQLPIIATPEDERQLLKFIHTLSPIRVFVCQVTAPDDAWIDNWETHDIQNSMFYVWLTNFAWNPEFAQTRPLKNNQRRWYISNCGHAPVIEVCRHQSPISQLSSVGRVYWAHHFSAPHFLEYDESAFNKCVDRIWSWIRRHGRRMELNVQKPYALPNAQNRFA